MVEEAQLSEILLAASQSSGQSSEGDGSEGPAGCPGAAACELGGFAPQAGGRCAFFGLFTFADAAGSLSSARSRAWEKQ